MEEQKRNYCKLIALFLVFTACTPHKPAERIESAESVESLEVILPQDAVREGGVFAVQVKSEKVLKDVTGQFIGKQIVFYPIENTESKQFSSLIGVNFGAEIKTENLTLKICFKDIPIDDTLTDQEKDCVTKEYKVVLSKGEFPSEKLKVSPRKVQPNAKDMIVIARDQKFLNQAYSSSVKEKFWEDRIRLPVESDITSVYGSNRVYNGKIAGAHLGTDFRAPTGTPIMAPLSGKAVISRKLFFTGYTVILDHGYGFFTIYGHMSVLKVKEGQIVKQGQIMGLSGATGRASGPHLHWGVRLHGAKVDPMSIVSLMK